MRINQWIGTCRYIYNMALYLKKDAYSKSISLSFYDLQKQLTTIKDVDWIKDVPSQSLQATIQELERTYQNFFKRGAGFPKFKSKKKTNSIPIKSVEHVRRNSFKLPKIGVLKTFNDRQPAGIPKTASIIKELDKFYLCVQCEVETKASTPCDKQTGIDVGLSNCYVKGE